MKKVQVTFNIGHYDIIISIIDPKTREIIDQYKIEDKGYPEIEKDDLFFFEKEFFYDLEEELNDLGYTLGKHTIKRYK